MLRVAFEAHVEPRVVFRDTAIGGIRASADPFIFVPEDVDYPSTHFISKTIAVGAE